MMPGHKKKTSDSLDDSGCLTSSTHGNVYINSISPDY